MIIININDVYELRQVLLLFLHFLRLFLRVIFLRICLLLSRIYAYSSDIYFRLSNVSTIYPKTLGFMTCKYARSRQSDISLLGSASIS